MTTVAIHQPQYLPWSGYMAKVAQADAFVFLDNVQYQKNGLQNRNEVRGATGRQWLTVPVRASRGLSIAETPIAQPGFARKHRATLRQCYAQAEHLDALDSLFEVLDQPWQLLADLTIRTTRTLLAELGIGTELHLASELGAEGRKTELVVDICRRMGASTYLSGTGAREYQEQSLFEGAGIDLRYQNFVPSPYDQGGASPFEAGLSVVDLLAHQGPQAATILTAGIQPPTFP